MQFYSDPSREKESYALPDCEVFEVKAGEWWYDEHGERCDPPNIDRRDLSRVFAEWTPCEAGWYYWFCFPGCLPESEPWGPFETAEAAIEDCRENASE